MNKCAEFEIAVRVREHAIVFVEVCEGLLVLQRTLPHDAHVMAEEGRVVFKKHRLLVEKSFHEFKAASMEPKENQL